MSTYSIKMMILILTLTNKTVITTLFKTYYNKDIYIIWGLQWVEMGKITVQIYQFCRMCVSQLGYCLDRGSEIQRIALLKIAMEKQQQSL